MSCLLGGVRWLHYQSAMVYYRSHVRDHHDIVSDAALSEQVTDVVEPLVGSAQLSC
jgi:hypothetical protein